MSNAEGWLLRQNDVRMQVLRTTDAGDSWRIQYDATDPVASTIQFVDATHGWVGGITDGPECHAQLDRIVEACHGAVLATSDGGAPWRLTSPTTLAITSIQFVSAATGWALAQRHCNACETNPIDVLRTTDGGASWKTTELPASEYEFDAQLAAIDAAHAVVATGSVLSANYTTAQAGVVSITDDAGATWQSAPSPCSHNDAAFPATDLARLTMLNARIGWAICADGAADGMRGSNLYQTRDGAQTWTLISEYGTAPAHPVPGVGTFPGGTGEMQFFDALHGAYVTEERGSFLCRTADGGQRWACAFAAEGMDSVSLLQFTDAQHAFISDDSRVGRTTDAGAHWSELQLPR